MRPPIQPILNSFNIIRLCILPFVLFSACSPCADPILIDRGKIADTALKMVPYQNGKTYRLQHSAGLVISFTATRQSREEYLECEECCKYRYKYEVDETTLTPDYPIFNLGFQISNFDSTRLSFSGNAGYYNFHIPSLADGLNIPEFAGSMVLDGREFYDVYRMKSDYGYLSRKDTIYPDSLYYSYGLGIIQLKMSNGERYSIYE